MRNSRRLALMAGCVATCLWAGSWWAIGFADPPADDSTPSTAQAAPIPRADQKPETAAETGVPRVQANVEYCRAGVNNRPLKMDIYLPPRPAQGEDGPYPAVLLFHGGSFVGGDRTVMNVMAIDFARRGYVAASVEYRLAPYQFPDMISDAKAAVRFIRGEAAAYHVDPARIGALGHSAGGTLALMLAVTPGEADRERSGNHRNVSSQICCAVSFAGLSDFDRNSPAMLRQMQFGMGFFLADWGAEQSSPARLVNAGDAPLMCVHGRQDETVPFAQSEMMREAYEKAGIECRVIAQDNLHHNFIFDARQYSKVMPDVFGWVGDHLHPTAPSVAPAQTERPENIEPEEDF